MFLFAISFWGSLWSYILHVFDFFFRYSFSPADHNSVETVPDFEGSYEKDDQIAVLSENDDLGFDQIERKESTNFDKEVENVSNASTSKYEFASSNTLCTFIEEPETINFTVQEMFAISNDDAKKVGFHEDHAPFENDFGACVDLVDNVLINSDEVVDHNSIEHVDYGEVNEQEVEDIVSFDKDELKESEVLNAEEKGLSDEIRAQLVSNSDDFWSSIHKYDGFSDDGAVSDTDIHEMVCVNSVESLEPETPMCTGDKRANYGEDSPTSSDDIPLVDSNNTTQFVNVNSVMSHKLIAGEYSDSDEELEDENSDDDESKGIDATDRCDDGELVDDEQTEMDALMEQKELIRRLKKEMRHLKISGLPTILEESESPRLEDDLRPLKIDERIEHKDRMDEIQVLYKKYLDKMRKLDILSQQSMYAIGLLQLKNQSQTTSNEKVSVPVIKSLLAQNFWSNKFRKHEADQVQKLIRDFQRDLELVYVGQVCLSWELLKWQHHKSEELHANDPDGFRQHNQVAGEFQKFQVLLQRFTEDEPFHHGPRIQHYVKSRCNQPNLLQVPLIKDDTSGEMKGKGEGGISIGMLKEVIGASTRTFWDFLHADKDEVHAISLIGIHGVHVELQDPSDAELLSEARSMLLKKERRLKDLVRSGNCIVRKFQKHRDQRLSHEMFLAQVELRLISRVLTMSRLSTDQLQWCHEKISKINIVGRKVHLDHSFSFFPC